MYYTCNESEALFDTRLEKEVAKSTRYKISTYLFYEQEVYMQKEGKKVTKNAIAIQTIRKMLIISFRSNS